MSRDNTGNIWGPPRRRQYHGSYGVNDVAPWVGDIEEFREPVEDIRNSFNLPVYGGEDNPSQEDGEDMADTVMVELEHLLETFKILE